MIIYIGADHAGYEHKEAIKASLKEAGHTVTDMGAASFDAQDDYPDFVTPVAKAVADTIGSFGIILGGSGQGEAMCANHTAGARAALYYGGDVSIITLAREHNNANILSLGARFLTEAEAQQAVVLFLQTPFSNGERHVRRLSKF
jgi:ribose 5-phosphate isomerase B